MASSVLEDDGKKNDKSVRRRGASIIDKIDKLTRNGRKIQLEWNTKDQPIGEHVSLFQHFIGYQTRARVSVGISDWKRVPQEIKELVCEAVMEKFEVEERKKHIIIASACKKWTDFKHTLTRDFLFINEEKTEIRVEPPEEFPFIDKDIWADFIQRRCTSQFQEVSERNSELAKKNKYPYRQSRKGYARIEEEMLKEKGLDPTKSSISRCELWMAGRQTSNGGYEGEVVNVVRNIDSLREQETQGQITVEGREDILALALGNEDHSGRIRGVGASVGVKKYFPHKRARYCNGPPDAKLIELQSQMEKLQQENNDRDQQMKELKSQVEFFQRKLLETHGGPPIMQTTVLPSDSASCSISKSLSPEEPMETFKRCQLFYPDLNTELAKGRIFVPAPGNVSMLHCRPLGPDELKVIVDVPLISDALVPIPTEEVTTVLEAAGSPVAWPKSMVVIVSDVNQCSNRASIPTPTQIKVRTNVNPPVQRHLTALEKYRVTYASWADTFTITSKIGGDVLNFPRELHISKEQVRAWIEEDTIDTIHVSLYVKYLYENRSSQKYAFFCPTHLSDVNKDFEKKARYMVDSMSKLEKDDRIWFAPYYKGFQWTLAVLNPRDNIVYWLDPTGNGVLDDIKGMIETAIVIFSVQRNKNNRKKTRWVKIMCPRQPPNVRDSGYYVCRYMREIIDHQCTVIPINYFRDAPSLYDKRLLDELREEWLQYLDTQQSICRMT